MLEKIETQVENVIGSLSDIADDSWPPPSSEIS